MKTDALKKIVEGLKEEAKDKEYIDNKDITDTNISNFLKKVRFVVDDRTPSEYVRTIIKDHPRLVPEEKVLDAIFNEIRDKQVKRMYRL